MLCEACEVEGHDVCPLDNLACACCMQTLENMEPEF